MENEKEEAEKAKQAREQTKNTQVPRQVILKQCDKANDRGKDKSKAPQEDEDLVTCHFESSFKDGLQDICGVISLIPPEFASHSGKTWEGEDYYETEDVGSNLFTHLIEQLLSIDCAIFKKLNEDSKARMRALFVAVRVGDMVIRRLC